MVWERKIFCWTKELEVGAQVLTFVLLLYKNKEGVGSLVSPFSNIRPQTVWSRNGGLRHPTSKHLSGL